MVRPWRRVVGTPAALTHLAVEASVALRAGALVGAVAVVTGAAVQAGPRVALIDVVLTVAAREAWRTQAGKGVDAVHAGTAVEAGAGGGWAAGGGGGERGWGQRDPAEAGTSTLASPPRISAAEGV